MHRLAKYCIVLFALTAQPWNVTAAECRFVNDVNDNSLTKSTALARVRSAALDGNSDCQWLLGTMYGAGMGTQASPVAACRWRVVAALSGNVAGRMDLAGTFGLPDNVYDPVFVYALLAEGAIRTSASFHLGVRRSQVPSWPRLS